MTNGVVATVDIVLHFQANLGDQNFAGVFLPGDVDVFRFRLDYSGDRNEGAEVMEGSSVRCCPDQAVSSEEEEEAFVVVEPALEMRPDFDDPMVVGLMVFVGGVVLFQDHRYKAVGKEGRLSWSLKPEKNVIVLVSRLIDDGSGMHGCSLKIIVAPCLGFGRPAASRNKVRNIFDTKPRDDLQVVGVSQVVWAFEFPLGRNHNSHSTLKRPLRLSASFHPR